MRNFDYLKGIDTLRSLYDYCNAAEIFQVCDPEQSAINSRRALEWITRAIYQIEGYEIKERTSLFELVEGQPFRVFVGNDNLLKAVHYIRKVGNAAAHTARVTKKESFFALLNIYNFVGAVLLKLGALQTLAPFNKELIPNKAPIHIIPPEKPQPEEEFIESVDASTIQNEPIQAEAPDMTEAETRKLFIDLMLKEAGWEVLDEDGRIMPGKACVEIEVEGMPNGEGKGYADYVLFGSNGKPLAVVEAKRTSVSPAKGKHQAELYADCLEAAYGIRPVIYYTNGFESHIIDGLGYPPRAIYGFHTEKDLAWLIQQRVRGNIKDLKIKDSITDRAYQKTAIKKVCEHLNAMHRRALLVMATGTGKTRVAISLVDVLMRNGWVKNVLFLADRTMLVNQAHKSFVKLLPNCTTCVLSDNSSDRDPNARLMFSTYQTMINYIDTEAKEFSVGKFDLVIIDEAHRSVFGKYGAIFKYFDSFLVGLTATPRHEIERSTYDLLELEDGDPNYAYELDEAVADGFLVPYTGLKRGSLILKEGIKYDKLTDKEKEQFEEIWEYEKAKKALKGNEGQPRDIDSEEVFTYIFNQDTIDKVLQDLMENGLKVQGGERIGKTMIFAYNHAHAELIVERFYKLYPEYGSDFCVLIDNYVTYAQDLKDKLEIRDANPQIAVSVDMLDTGVDIPDILNLVFFKKVRSKIKFMQMIGRGTRLSPDIFGEGQDKERFYIFDWCRNFEFFGSNPQGVEASPAQSLTERLFCLKTDIAFELQHATHQAIPYHKQLHDNLKAELLEQVKGLNDLHVSVRTHWQAVTRFRGEQNWMYISQVDVSQLKNEIAPLLAKSQDDEGAKRFDILALIVELSLLNDEVNAKRSKKNIITIAQHLQEKASIPQVMAKMDVINEVLTDNFWQNLTLEEMERVRVELRELMKFVVGEKLRTFCVDVEDTISYVGEADIVYTTSYKQRVIDYLAQNKDLPVLQKIFNIQPLEQADIQELERILWDELGSKEDYSRYTRDMLCGDFVAAFIRSIIGVDRGIALRKFTDFISNADLNSQQEEYLKTIINYVCENGDISRGTLINVSPFDGYNLIDTFGTNAKFVGEYVDVLHSVIVA